ncbi:MAG: hypothetical protein AB4290_19180 [Spirulina sp.]
MGITNVYSKTKAENLVVGAIHELPLQNRIPLQQSGFGITIGVCVRDLEFIAKAADPEDLINQVEYLPL